MSSNQTKVVCIYYNYSLATDNRNGSNTFVFFDDFSNNWSVQWNIHVESGDITWDSSNEWLSCGGGSTSSPYGHTVLGSNKTYSDFVNGTVEFRHYSTTNSIGEVGIRGNPGGNTGYKLRYDERAGSEATHYKPPYSSWSGFGDSIAKWIDVNTWYNGRIEAKGTTIRVYDNDIARNNETDSDYAGPGEISLQNHYGSDETRYDDVRVSKFSSLSDTVTVSLGEENMSSGGTSWTFIGNHTNGSVYTWNATNINGSVNLDLRCRCIDTGGSNTYSSYFTKGCLLNISISGEGAAAGDNCSCPGAGTDKIFNLSLHCNITSNCIMDVMSFKDTGWINFSCTLNVSDINHSGLMGNGYYFFNKGTGKLIRRR